MIITLLYHLLLLLLLLGGQATASSNRHHVATTATTNPESKSVDLSALHNNDLKALKAIINITETGKQVSQHCQALAGPYAWFFTRNLSTGKTTVNSTVLRLAIANTHDSESVEAHFVKYGEAVLSLQSWNEVVEQGIAPCERVQAAMQHWDHAAVPARQDVVDCMKGAYALYDIVLPAVSADDQMLEASLADIESDLNKSKMITTAAMSPTEKRDDQRWHAWAWDEIVRYGRLGTRVIASKAIGVYHWSATRNMKRTSATCTIDGPPKVPRKGKLVNEGDAGRDEL